MALGLLSEWQRETSESADLTDLSRRVLTRLWVRSDSVNVLSCGDTAGSVGQVSRGTRSEGADRISRIRWLPDLMPSRALQVMRNFVLRPIQLRFEALD